MEQRLVIRRLPQAFEMVKKELTSLSVQIGEDDKRSNRNERGRCGTSLSQ